MPLKKPFGFAFFLLFFLLLFLVLFPFFLIIRVLVRWPTIPLSRLVLNILMFVITSFATTSPMVHSVLIGSPLPTCLPTSSLNLCLTLFSCVIVPLSALYLFNFFILFLFFRSLLMGVC